MKLISNDEFENTPQKGRGRSSIVFNAILNLKPGENLHIEKADWKKRYPPSRITSYVGKRNSRKFKSVSRLDGNGWMVKRIS